MKTVFCFFAAILTAAAQIPSTGLVARYDFQDAQTQPTAVDSIGGYTGYAVGSAVPWGQNGPCLYDTSACAGSGGYGSFQFPTLPNLSGSDLSIVMAVKISASQISSIHAVLLANQLTGSPFTGYFFSIASGKLEWNPGGLGVAWESASTTVTDGAEHVVSITISNTTGKFYVDGVLDGTITTTRPTTGGSSSGMGFIWQSNWVHSPYYQLTSPAVSNLLLYNRALTGAEETGISATLLPFVAKTSVNPATVTAAPTNLPANGLALVPPMGWNSWYYGSVNVTESQMHTQSDALASGGYVAAGYNIFGIDGTYMTRDTGGTMICDPANFPSGCAALGAYIHGNGELYGQYSSPGPVSCQIGVGSYAHVADDATTMASWGVDHLKYDLCSAQSLWSTYTGTQQNIYQYGYQLMAQALRATGRPISYNVATAGVGTPYAWAANAGGNMWRMGGDLNGTWSSFVTTLLSNASLASYAGPGHWNDMDIMPIAIQGAGTTETEHKSVMSLYAIMAAPMFIGADLTALSAHDKTTLLNAGVIAVDQDTVGQQGTWVSNTSCGSATCPVIVKQLYGSNNWAVTLTNLSSTTQTVSTTWAAIHSALPQFSNTSYNGYDLWGAWPSCAANNCRTAFGGNATGFSVSLASHATAMYTLTTDQVGGTTIGSGVSISGGVKVR